MECKNKAIEFFSALSAQPGFENLDVVSSAEHTAQYCADTGKTFEMLEESELVEIYKKVRK